jgi:AcrR family transcriptional regulator
MARQPGKTTKASGVAPARQRRTSSRSHVTKARLQFAAREVFERDGFLNARISDISHGAGVSHGSFYTHFKSKDEIFRAVIISAIQEMLGASRGSDQGDPNPVTVLHRANKQYLDAFAQHAQLMLLWEHVAAFDPGIHTLLVEWRRPFIERAQRGIARLQAAGVADPKLDAAGAAQALVGMIRQFTIDWAQQGALSPDYSPGEVTITRIWANALRLPADMVDQALADSTP